ncbi:gamma carbonic anhydrase family protein [Insolitispirillum peregrinum]|uniref:Carbonic anhydrase or acetyltransferase, isoleucine patch superfamily n=1 Tax=Insolitispirillum peregrinum TaxID=80876 RepID=A0A1N7LMC5_9PROT|nr:gamma carbonic anhydrase family protein [Insolitispirillum peregrinum]SIS74942.1 Carbonic anhydrase or acetyltransferase, isoleucine patch superfamily [Insolitispirillum peregrinum]
MPNPIILPWRGVEPAIADTAFVAPGAAVIGDVEIGAGSSIWFGCVVRGDVHEIRIGERSNIQDGTVIHVSKGKFGTYIGDDVLVGHGCVIHACTLESGSFVGMGATVLDGAVVESGGMLAAGATLTPGKRLPRGELWAGAPAKKLRDLSEDEMAGFIRQCAGYAELAEEYKTQLIIGTMR